MASAIPAAGHDALFLLRSAGGGQVLERLDPWTGTTMTMMLPWNVGIIEEIVGRPSSDDSAIIYLRDDNKRIFLGWCSTESEACMWFSIGSGDHIRGDTAQLP